MFVITRNFRWHARTRTSTSDDVPSPLSLSLPPPNSFSLFLLFRRERTDRNVTRHSGSLYIPDRIAASTHPRTADLSVRRLERSRFSAVRRGRRRPCASSRPRSVSDTQFRRGDVIPLSGGHAVLRLPPFTDPECLASRHTHQNGLTHSTEKTHRRLTVAWRPYRALATKTLVI